MQTCKCNRKLDTHCDLDQTVLLRDSLITLTFKLIQFEFKQNLCYSYFRTCPTDLQQVSFKKTKFLSLKSFLQSK